jgi:hypothetical protein
MYQNFLTNRAEIRLSRTSQSQRNMASLEVGMEGVGDKLLLKHMDCIIVYILFRVEKLLSVWWCVLVRR